MEDEVSEIFAFKISDPSKSSNIGIKNSILLQLEEAIGTERFNSFFGEGGALQGFNPTSEYSINGSTVNQSTINNLMSKFKNKTLDIQTIQVEND